MTNVAKAVSSGKYLKSAINRIYKSDSDFVLIGLTGRTGSGCSTVAHILQAKKNEIRHSLFSGNKPTDNATRKDRIIQRFFESQWKPFLQIQVRSIISTFILDESVEGTKKQLEKAGASKQQIEEFTKVLVPLKNEYRAISTDDERYVEFYTKILPLKCEMLRQTMGESAFVKFYQVVGKNIRLSGFAYKNRIKSNGFFTLVERIDGVVRNILRSHQAKKQSTCIVIDSIRNPLEAIYFQDRYSSFYLMAVSCPEEDRIKRLRHLNYTEGDIKSIDDVEYTPKDLHEPEYFSVQDIQACLQRADLYISNPDVETHVVQFQNLSNQIIKFVSLIKRPGLVTPSPIERCMQIAYTAKLNSGCISRQVGAAATDENFSVRSIGWNDAPYGQVPCNLRNREDLVEGLDVGAYSDYEKSDEEYVVHFRSSSVRYEEIPHTGRNNSFCFKSEYNQFKNEKNQVHTRSLHAEENAFLQLAKYGSSGIEGGKLFTTASPCELCAKKAYQLGIREIYYIDPYPGIAMSHILRGGTNDPKLMLFSGAIGRAFHQLYSPVLPYKDELLAITT